MTYASIINHILRAKFKYYWALPSSPHEQGCKSFISHSNTRWTQNTGESGLPLLLETRVYLKKQSNKWEHHTTEDWTTYTRKLWVKGKLLTSILRAIVSAVMWYSANVSYLTNWQVKKQSQTTLHHQLDRYSYSSFVLLFRWYSIQIWIKLGSESLQQGPELLPITPPHTRPSSTPSSTPSSPRYPFSITPNSTTHHSPVSVPSIPPVGDAAVIQLGQYIFAHSSQNPHIVYSAPLPAGMLLVSLLYLSHY